MSSPSNPSSRDAATSLPCIDRHTQLTPPPPPSSIASISGINTRMEFELRVFENPGLVSLLSRLPHENLHLCLQHHRTATGDLTALLRYPQISKIICLKTVSLQHHRSPPPTPTFTDRIWFFRMMSDIIDILRRAPSSAPIRLSFGIPHLQILSFLFETLVCSINYFRRMNSLLQSSKTMSILHHFPNLYGRRFRANKIHRRGGNTRS
ncbi:hypothetical protein LXL04_007951 [Taraxacum kok-saghyz]